ncbi:helix-turn-helix domain-containing protein [Staphylococcus xylosus]|uniref:helix-turn-helix domain-containing protein n=1 Tax=Staphylococcus xylosus TaxID=1288 RepID=UPI002DBDE3C0|nr:helix-turn-helix domain-containing protein [Staphylococcus xylosus]MEB6299046.1 helix-turn-helix domain-containing protein [Staphylococcus xylosus]
MDKDKLLTTKETAKLLDLRSTTAVLHLIKKKALPNAYKQDLAWRIPLNDIKNILDKRKNSIDTKEAMEILRYNNTTSIIDLINLSIFPNAFKLNGTWRIPLSDIENYKFKSSQSLSTTEAAIELGLSSNVAVSLLIRRNIFPNVFKFQGKWRIPRSDFDEYKEIYYDNGYLSIDKIMIILKKSKSAILSYIHSGVFPKSIKLNGSWRIHKDDLKNYESNLEKKKFVMKIQRRKYNSNKRIKLHEDPLVQDYISAKEISENLNLSRYEVHKLFKDNTFNHSKKYGKQWWVPIKEYRKYLIYRRKIEIDLKNSLTAKEAAEKLGYKHSANIVNLINSHKLFPNSFKHNNTWYIPKKEIEEFQMRKVSMNRKIDYTPSVAVKEIKEFVDNFDTKIELTETKKLFKQYCSHQINKIRGSSRYLRDRILLYKRFYNTLINNITNEIFLLSTEEIDGFFQNSSLFKKGEKKILILFLKYVYSQKGISPEIEFSLLSSEPREKTKELYNPDLFFEIYQYIKEFKTHISSSLNNRSYANMWVYTILLMTDFIRGQDLILNTPNINLQQLDIEHLKWFDENYLTDSQIESVIKQLYIHFRHQRSNKTDELLTFIVSPDLKESLAYGLVISELHRRNMESDLILDTFTSGKYNNINTAGKMSHKSFFDKLDNKHNFIFSSRKMNNTVATYLFYSIAEEDGQDSELALYLTQVSRSHKKADSTRKYIQATNKDGSINRVSYNLFKRGHFGWLYNYLIIFLNHLDDVHHTLEERTRLIENVREDVSLGHLENLAEFTLDTTLPHNESNQNVEYFLEKVYTKRKNLVSKLQDYTKNEIQEILIKLSKGDLPSKNENAQCLVSPSCINPQLTNCFSCEYVIPNNLILIQLNEEMQRLISKIKEEENSLLIKRETRFLLHTLFVWKEARLSFGNDVVNTYIPSQGIWDEINQISHKLTLE